MRGPTRLPADVPADRDTGAVPAPRAAGPVSRYWERLRATPTPERIYDPAEWTAQPEPVRRWLDHAMAAGTPRTTVAGLPVSGYDRFRDGVVEMRWRCHPLGWYPFVVTASAEGAFGGVTIPTVLRAG